MSTMDTPQADPHLVVIGAGFGGLQVVRALRNAPLRITVIDQHNHHLFQPLLYQVATAGLSPSDITAPIRSILRSQKNVDVMLATVTGIDRENNCVLTDTRPVSFDYLVIASGASGSYFGHDSWAENAPGLKTIDDAIEIRQRVLTAYELAESETDKDRIQACLTFVIVGAGPTGVELAGAISELARRALVDDFRHIDTSQTKIILVEAGPHILASFPTHLSSKARSALEEHGVEVRVGHAIEDIESGGVRLDGRSIPAGTVIWAAGVQASPAAHWMGSQSDKAGRIVVNADLTVPGHPHIFAIGDTAAIPDYPLPGVAPVAMQQGRYVAQLLIDKLQNNVQQAPFHYVDKGNLATVGRSFAIVDFHGIKLAGKLAWVMWLGVHIFYLIGFKNRFVVMFQWAWAYATYQRGARLITKKRVG